MYSDIISIKHSDGTIINDIKASVQKSKIFILDPKTLCNEGDIINYILHNGQKTQYKVIRTYCPKNHHWELDVEKL